MMNTLKDAVREMPRGLVLVAMIDEIERLQIRVAGLEENIKILSGIQDRKAVEDNHRFDGTNGNGYQPKNKYGFSNAKPPLKP